METAEEFLFKHVESIHKAALNGEKLEVIASVTAWAIDFYKSLKEYELSLFREQFAGLGEPKPNPDFAIGKINDAVNGSEIDLTKLNSMTGDILSNLTKEGLTTAKHVSFNAEPSEEQRSCFNCNNLSICFVYRDIMNSTKEIGVNIDGEEAPGKWTEVFNAMGNCCLKFKKRE